jgi:hypothetical protein
VHGSESDGRAPPITLNHRVDIFTAQKAAPPVDRPGTRSLLQADGDHEPFAAGDAWALLFAVLPANLHDGLHAPVLRTDHLEHPLVLRSSFEECG